MFTVGDAPPKYVKQVFWQRALAHPKAFALDLVADHRLFAGQVVLVEERADFLAPALIDHPLDRLVRL